MYITKHRPHLYLSLLVTFTLLPIKIYVHIGDISSHIYTNIACTYVCRYFCIYFLRCDPWRPWFYIDLHSSINFKGFIFSHLRAGTWLPLPSIQLFIWSKCKESLELHCFVCSPRWLHSEISLIYILLRRVSLKFHVYVLGTQKHTPLVLSWILHTSPDFSLWSCISNLIATKHAMPCTHSLQKCFSPAKL